MTALRNPPATQQPTEWKGLTGHFTKEIILKYLHKEENPICYLAGPAGMVKAMRVLLNSCGIDDDDIRAEEFTGY